ncbi:unnamed protein product [Agarophyton chilense]|eukprot:gb/GEZJ01000537.1/.p2 GENE.gb/GEZJ01000537.1/~~gb/GEZJ01000537.1/.p2  ORF type:complete len:787 (-),score=86.12 gb/GEZJ01000537.1/:6691-9051(-)
MLRILAFIVVLLSVPTSSLAAPTKRVVTLEAVFDSTEQRLSLNSKDIHGHYSRFMELSGKGNLCPRTITHLTNGNHDTTAISLPHEEITHDGSICNDGGLLMLKYEKKLSSDAIADIFGLQKDVTGFKRSIRKVLLSLDGFYIGKENQTRSCVGSSLTKGAAVLITSDSEPFGNEFHIPFHGHPKVMLINDKHKACAFTSTWGSPSPIPVQPTETKESRYGPVSVTISLSPNPSNFKSPMSSTEPTKSTVMPSSTPRPSSKADTEDMVPSPQSSPIYNRELPSIDASSKPSKDAESQEYGPTPGKTSPKAPTETHTSTATATEGRPSTLATESVSPTSPNQTKIPYTTASPSPATDQKDSKTQSITPSSPEKSTIQIQHPSPSTTGKALDIPSYETAPPKEMSNQATPKASQYPSPSTKSRGFKTLAPNATTVFSSSQVSKQPRPSISKPSTSPSASRKQNIKPPTATKAVSPINVVSATGSPTPSIYPDSSKAPKIVDFASTGGRPEQSTTKGKEGNPLLEQGIILRGTHSPTAEPSKANPHLVFGHIPSASILPSFEVSTPSVQESPVALSDPQMSKSDASQSAIPSSENSSTPSPSTSEAPQNDGSSCFPAGALTVGGNGNLIRVEDLRVGNRVMVADGILSPVIDFSHAEKAIVFPFSQFITEGGKSLTVTSSHYIYTQRGLLPARDVSASDFLTLSNGTLALVTAKIQIFDRGLFNPHTSHGDIIIDGFKVSSYTSAIEPRIAHALMAPIRLLDMLGSRPSLLSFFVRNPLVMRYFNIRSS